MSRKKAFAFILLTLFLQSGVTAWSAGQTVRDLLKIEKGCYPVSYNDAGDTIGVVCRGDANWIAEAVIYFNTFKSDSGYYNSLGVVSTLDNDLDNGIGPGPWLKYYFSEIDKKKIPRPQ